MNADQGGQEPGAGSSACVGCGAALPDVEGPVHPYLQSSPACWAAYSEVLAREYADPGLFQSVHRLTVDTYAAQHPGQPSPQAIRSVALHLVGLCTVIADGGDPAWAGRIIREGAANKRRFTWLQPPTPRGVLTVADVGRAVGAGEHERRVRQWASSVWDAWAPHHATVRLWCSWLRDAHSLPGR